VPLRTIGADIASEAFVARLLAKARGFCAGERDTVVGVAGGGFVAVDTEKIALAVRGDALW
jgi:hypothetical protein